MSRVAFDYRQQQPPAFGSGGQHVLEDRGPFAGIGTFVPRADGHERLGQILRSIPFIGLIDLSEGVVLVAKARARTIEQMRALGIGGMSVSPRAQSRDVFLSL